MATRTTTTLSGGTYVLIYPAQLTNLLHGPTGPVVRDMIVRGDRVKHAMIRLCPVVTGNMRDHIVKRIAKRADGEPTVLVGIEKVKYAIWVVKGSQPHDIYPKSGGVLAWQADTPAGASYDRQMFGDYVYAAHVSHPGNAPNDFMFRALREAK